MDGGACVYLLMLVWRRVSCLPPGESDWQDRQDDCGQNHAIKVMSFITGKKKNMKYWRKKNDWRAKVVRESKRQIRRGQIVHIILFEFSATMTMATMVSIIEKKDNEKCLP